jgi:hypothetical protein
LHMAIGGSLCAKIFRPKAFPLALEGLTRVFSHLMKRMQWWGTETWSNMAWSVSVYPSYQWRILDEDQGGAKQRRFRANAEN